MSNYLIGKWLKTWKRLPRGVLAVPCLAVFRRLLDNALKYYALIFGQPRSGQAVGRNDCCRSLPTRIIPFSLLCFSLWLWQRNESEHTGIVRSGGACCIFFLLLWRVVSGGH